jgi:hypothetical protein
MKQRTKQTVSSSIMLHKVSFSRISPDSFYKRLSISVVISSLFRCPPHKLLLRIMNQDESFSSNLKSEKFRNVRHQRRGHKMKDGKGEDKSKGLISRGHLQESSASKRSGKSISGVTGIRDEKASSSFSS